MKKGELISILYFYFNSQLVALLIDYISGTDRKSVYMILKYTACFGQHNEESLELKIWHKNGLHSTI